MNAMRNTAQKQLRADCLSAFPYVEPYIEHILPKKEQFRSLKSYASLYCITALIPFALDTYTYTHRIKLDIYISCSNVLESHKVYP